MMGASVARGLPRCDSRVQGEELLRYLRDEHRATSLAWAASPVSRTRATGPGLRARLSSFLGSRRSGSDAPAAHVRANLASVHFAEGVRAQPHDLVAAPVLLIAAGSDSAPVCAHSREQ